MVIVLLTGGLGNQMFQYCLYKKLISIGRDVRIDDNRLRTEGNEHNGLELERVFGINYRRASVRDVKAFNNKYNLKGAFRQVRKMFGRQVPPRGYKEGRLVYRNDFYKLKDVYLWGYWQSWKYFYELRDDILKDFSFRYIDNARNNELLESIKNTNAVSIHVRRGDYLKAEYAAMFGNICTKDYYMAAVSYMEKTVGKCHFYIFTDDVDWVLQNMDFAGEYTVVDWNRGADSYMDMYFMTLCRHNIIANSSFSWWGAWLNQNPDKVVIAPKKWSNDEEDFKDTVPDDWVRL